MSGPVGDLPKDLHKLLTLFLKAVETVEIE